MEAARGSPLGRTGSQLRVLHHMAAELLNCLQLRLPAQDRALQLVIVDRAHEATLLPDDS